MQQNKNGTARHHIVKLRRNRERTGLQRKLAQKIESLKQLKVTGLDKEENRAQDKKLNQYIKYEFKT